MSARARKPSHGHGMLRFLLLTIILAVAAMGAWADTSTMTLDDAPEEVVIKVYPKRQVTLDHKGHAKRMRTCRVCHHKPDSEKCSDCHEAKGDSDVPSFSEVMHYICKGCHKKSREGLTGACSECHQNVRSGG